MDKVALLGRGEEPRDALGFVKALMEASDLGGSEAMGAMYELFDTRTPLRGPVRIPLKADADAADFARRCAEHGISATVQDAWP